MALSGYEQQLQFKGARQRSDGWYELGLFVAWHAALFTRAKTLPPLAPLMKKVRTSKVEAQAGPAKTQHWHEMKGIMAAHRMALTEPKGKAKTKPAPPARRRK